MPATDHQLREIYNIQVSAHAISRFKDRCGNAQISDLSAASRIRNVIQNGKEFVIKDPVLAVRQLLAHDCAKARYFKEGKVMVVLEERVVVTCHLAEANRWVPKN